MRYPEQEPCRLGAPVRTLKSRCQHGVTPVHQSCPCGITVLTMQPSLACMSCMVPSPQKSSMRICFKLIQGVLCFSVPKCTLCTLLLWKVNTPFQGNEGSLKIIPILAAPYICCSYTKSRHLHDGNQYGELEYNAATCVQLSRRNSSKTGAAHLPAPGLAPQAMGSLASRAAQHMLGVAKAAPAAGFNDAHHCRNAAVHIPAGDCF